MVCITCTKTVLDKIVSMKFEYIFDPPPPPNGTIEMPLDVELVVRGRGLTKIVHTIQYKYKIVHTKITLHSTIAYGDEFCATNPADAESKERDTEKS